MSQREVEGLLGRLLTDSNVRERFFESPEETIRDESYQLSAREVGALLRLDEEDLQVIACRVSPLAREDERTRRDPSDAALANRVPR